MKSVRCIIITILLLTLLTACGGAPSDTANSDTENGDTSVSDVSDDYSHWYTFEYDGVKYDLSQISPGINGVWEWGHIGKYVIAEGHVSPYNSIYAVINTETAQIEHHFAGVLPTYHSDDINTIVYAFWNSICAYDGTVLAVLELNEFEEIYALSYSEDKAQIEVTVKNEDTEWIVTIDRFSGEE